MAPPQPPDAALLKPGRLQTAYNVIITPLNFTVFIFSLLLVDIRLSRTRVNTHSSNSSRMPRWLHTMLYRSQTYGGNDVYYHTKQKKLMRMEAEQAFEMRNTMVLILAVGLLGAVGGGWWMMSRVYRHWVLY